MGRDASTRRPGAVIAGALPAAWSGRAGSPEMRELLGPADEVAYLHLLAVEADGALPVPEGADAAAAQHAEICHRAMSGDRRQGDVEHAGVLRTHVPRLSPIARIVAPDQILVDLVEAAVDEERVLVDASA